MKYFPLILHVILAGAAVGLAVGLNHVTPINPVKAYTATGFAVGLGATAVVRIFLLLLG